jgi:crotonobetainyl-CoA:carnitine CoA-transferase CaiB-like acyl-CoA transferase
MPVPSSPSPGESASPAAAAVRPFDGLVVVELGHSVAAPFAGQILSELGAEVIKVEKPDGDDARRWGPPFWEGAASTFQALNRNKRSVVRDLRSPQELAELVTLIVERADVVLQNLRPGQVEKLGLDGQTLTRLKPGLIYCNLGAFGREGPLKDRPGYDPLMQAFGGIMSTTGEPGRPAVRVGASIVDMGTGMWAVIGILTALHERKSTGKGRVVDISLFETAACWVSLLASHYQASGEPPGKQGSGAAGIVPYKAYETLDGEIVVAAGSDSLFRRLAALVGRPEWAQDERFADNPARVAHQTDLYRMLDELFRVHPTAHWVERLEAAGIPCSPVQDVAQMLAHPQTQALGLVQPVPDSAMQFIGLPLSFDGQRSSPRSRPPRLGEHTNDLFPKGE